jgi:hypothetical protein
VISIVGMRFLYISLSIAQLQRLFSGKSSSIRDGYTSFESHEEWPRALVSSEMMKEDKVASRKVFLTNDKLYVNL